MHLRRFLLVFLGTLPLALAQMGWYMIPAVAIVTYALLGIEEIGVQLEDPFGREDNDLPLDAICQTIQANLMEILDRHLTTLETTDTVVPLSLPISLTSVTKRAHL